MNSDQRWIDKLIEIGEITAVNTSQLKTQGDDIQRLKGLYDRVGRLEGKVEDLDDDREKDDEERASAHQAAILAKPAHRQGAIALWAFVLSIIGLVANIVLTIIFHHP